MFESPHPSAPTTAFIKRRFRSISRRGWRAQRMPLHQTFAMSVGIVFGIWTFTFQCAMLITSSGGRSYGSDGCDLPLLSK